MISMQQKTINQESKDTPKNNKSTIILIVVGLVLAVALFAVLAYQGVEQAKIIEPKFAGTSFTYHKDYGGGQYLDIHYSFSNNNTFSSRDSTVIHGQYIPSHSGRGRYSVSSFLNRVKLTVTTDDGFSQSFSVYLDPNGTPISLKQGDVILKKDYR